MVLRTSTGTEHIKVSALQSVASHLFVTYKIVRLQFEITALVSYEEFVDHAITQYTQYCVPS